MSLRTNLRRRGARQSSINSDIAMSDLQILNIKSIIYCHNCGTGCSSALLVCPDCDAELYPEYEEDNIFMQFKEEKEDGTRIYEQIKAEDIESEGDIDEDFPF